MTDSNTNLPRPNGRRFASFRIACMLTGFSSSSLCHYVAKSEGVSHVSPGAYTDYVSQHEWPTLYSKVKALIDLHGIDKASELLHREKYGGV